MTGGGGGGGGGTNLSNSLLHLLTLPPPLTPTQTLKQMPTAHKRTFVFLVTFMKDLLKCSEVNCLDHKVLGKSTIPYTQFMAHTMGVGVLNL